MPTNPAYKKLTQKLLENTPESVIGSWVGEGEGISPMPLKEVSYDSKLELRVQVLSILMQKRDKGRGFFSCWTTHVLKTNQAEQ